MELLVKRGVSVLDRDRTMGWSAIHHACNHPPAIEVVLRLGGDVNAEDDYHMTVRPSGR
jgi:hypothetical protein